MKITTKRLKQLIKESLSTNNQRGGSYAGYTRDQLLLPYFQNPAIADIDDAIIQNVKIIKSSGVVSVFDQVPDEFRDNLDRMFNLQIAIGIALSDRRQERLETEYGGVYPDSSYELPDEPGSLSHRQHESIYGKVMTWYDEFKTYLPENSKYKSVIDRRIERLRDPEHRTKQIPINRFAPGGAKYKEKTKGSY